MNPYMNINTHRKKEIKHTKWRFPIWNGKSLHLNINGGGMNHFTAHATDWILLDFKQTFALHLCYYDCVAN